MSVEELISALEKADEPDRALDLAISEIAGRHGTTVQHRDAREFLERNKRMPALCAWLPAYTMSVDAAMELLPKNVKWSIGTRDRLNWGMSAEQCEMYWADISPYDGNGCDTASPEPAIALCLAALLYRAMP